MCQLRALLNDMWGEAPAAKPSLRMVAGFAVKEPAIERQEMRPTLKRVIDARRKASAS